MTNLKPRSKYSLIKIIRDTEKAIKLKCYNCQCFQKKLDCQFTPCTLYPYRPWASKKHSRFPKPRK